MSCEYRLITNTAMGDAVNLAARLEDASERSEILIGPDTHRLTAPLFEFEALAPLRVKGKAEPVEVYRLLAAKAVRGKVRGIEGLESPLVGRESEFRALQEAVERLQAGVGGIVTIVGKAGLGKSRLVAELRKSANQQISELAVGGGTGVAVGEAMGEQAPPVGDRRATLEGCHHRAALGANRHIWAARRRRRRYPAAGSGRSSAGTRQGAGPGHHRGGATGRVGRVTGVTRSPVAPRKKARHRRPGIELSTESEGV